MNDHVQTLKPVPPIPRPGAPARVIGSDSEAIEVANELAAEFAKQASLRDLERRWPVQELDAFSQSGLWSLNVPKAFGGPELSYATIARVVEIISAADSSIGQIAQNHIGVVAAVRTVSDEAQQTLLFGDVLNGVRFGNAFSEFGSKRAADFETRFEDKGDHVIVTGKKFYSTGALLAHLVPIVAVDAEGRAWYAIADRGAEGLTVIDDWSSFGQRTTLSGTVILDHVKVPKAYLVPGYKGYDKPTADGAIFQIIQVAVDAGIAKAAIDETVRFVRTKSRPWIDSGKDRAADDPYTIQAVGGLTLRLHAAEALQEKAGRAIDEAAGRRRRRTWRGRKSSPLRRRFFRPKSQSTPPTSCLSSPVRARRSPSTIWIGTGATRAPIRSTTRCDGNTRFSATISSTERIRPCTPGVDETAGGLALRPRPH
jgi:SfnB family sulfur acquisition oxidoreductase